MKVPHPFGNSTRGTIAGPDGYLHIVFGDGGSGGDPFGTIAPKTLFCTLRIDVDRAVQGEVTF